MGNSPPNELLPRKGAVAQINERLVEFVAAVAVGKEAESGEGRGAGRERVSRGEGRRTVAAAEPEWKRDWQL